MKMTMHRSLVPLTLLATVSVGMSACSQPDSASFESSTQQGTGQDQAPEGSTGAAQENAEAGPAAGDAGVSTAPEAQSAAAAGIDPATLGNAIATATVPARVQGDPEATLDVSLHSLTRDGKTLIGIFSFTVHSTTQNPEPAWLYDYLGGQSWSPHLIDTVNLTRHDVLAGGSITKAMTSSQGSMYVLPGQTVYGYAAFAAPPEDVTSLRISLVDGSPAIEVPLQ